MARRVNRLGRGLTVLLALLAVLATPAAAKQHHRVTKPSAKYYLALGDSLAVGFQPGPTGAGAETGQGYANDLYAYARKRIHHLRLVELGCPGDTTGSMLTGTGNAGNAAAFHCDRRGGSQLAAAVAFLRAHHKPGEVPLVTVDIGGNDVDGCVTPGVDLSSCVAAGERAITSLTPKILSALRRAAPRRTRLAAMTLYDPVLADFLLPPYSPSQSLGELSVALLKAINGDIASADHAAGFLTADVAGAFDSYDSTDMALYNGVSVPLNVARVCALSWACTPPPQGPSIHANAGGYAAIAGAFERVLGRL